MTTIPYSPAEVKALCEEVDRYGIKLSRTTAWTLLRLVKDRHLCVDALLMPHRPVWLEAIVGEVVVKAEPKETKKEKPDEKKA